VADWLPRIRQAVETPVSSLSEQVLVMDLSREPEINGQHI